MATKELTTTYQPYVSNAQHLLFLKHYTNGCNFNATKAAEKAGYAFPAVSGHELLQREDIKRELAAIVNATAMTQPEVIARHAKIARGIGQYVSVNEYDVYRADGTDEFGNEQYVQCGRRGDTVIDVAAMVANGDAEMIKSVKPGKYGDAIECYAMDAAQDRIAKWHGLYQDVNVHVDQLTINAKPANHDEQMTALRRLVAAHVESQALASANERIRLLEATLERAGIELPPENENVIVLPPT